MSGDTTKLHQLTVEFKNGEKNKFIYESDMSIENYHLLFNNKEEANGILASFEEYGLGLNWKEVNWYEVKIKD